ncbi:hypothetical protein KR76_00164 [Pimelobacter simplex]|uniref:Uncharacterized protein n=1 Tax=Nocardioides simplex TaxID=2045 RepID=A0A0C5XI80_NOCSI|nr:hypothetical protein KR76_00164 [Pimelobacter simplex]
MPARASPVTPAAEPHGRIVESIRLRGAPRRGSVRKSAISRRSPAILHRRAEVRSLVR